MKAVSRSDAKEFEFDTEQSRFLIRSYVGTWGPMMHRGPSAFVTDMLTETTYIDAHFHDVDQFQIFFRGSGRFGHHQVSPVWFHYADAFTPYGPIAGDKDGIAFLTIRAACASGHYSIPASRHLMQGKPGRNISGRFEPGSPLPPRGEAHRESLLDSVDGLNVTAIRMGPGASAPGLPTDAGAQYYLVCSGSILQGGRELPELSLTLAESGEPTPMLTAGIGGAEVLLFQMPRASDRPGSDVRKLAERELVAYRRAKGRVTELG